MATIYNSTDGPLIVDRAGRVLGARERLEDADVSSSPIAGHIEAGRIVVVDEGEAQADDAADEQPAELEAPKAGKSRRTTPAPSTEEA